MSRKQRLTFLGIAAVIAVAAIIVLTAGGDADETAQDSANTSAQQTATPSATPGAEETEESEDAPTPTPTPKPQPPLLQAGKVTKLRFTEGETVRFRVRHDAPEHIHIHGYDIMRDLTPNKTITVSFPAKITGIFEIELEDSAEEIGELRVDPK
jgi:FtsP/CotA-like multicopper oxidase with cupredoxin domain